jgi:hypothetical protein
MFAINVVEISAVVTGKCQNNFRCGLIQSKKAVAALTTMAKLLNTLSLTGLAYFYNFSRKRSFAI